MTTFNWMLLRIVYIIQVRDSGTRFFQSCCVSLFERLNGLDHKLSPSLYRSAAAMSRSHKDENVLHSAVIIKPIPVDDDIKGRKSTNISASIEMGLHQLRIINFCFYIYFFKCLSWRTWSVHKASSPTQGTTEKTWNNRSKDSHHAKLQEENGGESNEFRYVWALFIQHVKLGFGSREICLKMSW